MLSQIRFFCCCVRRRYETCFSNSLYTITKGLFFMLSANVRGVVAAYSSYILWLRWESVRAIAVFSLDTGLLYFRVCSTRMSHFHSWINGPCTHLESGLHRALYCYSLLEQLVEHPLHQSPKTPARGRRASDGDDDALAHKTRTTRDW